MILLDTSVLSAPMAPEPNERVFALLAARPRATLSTASAVEGQIGFLSVDVDFGGIGKPFK